MVYEDKVLTPFVCEDEEKEEEATPETPEDDKGGVEAE